MTEEEIIEYLKNHLRIRINYDGYDNNYNETYKITISLKDEDICSTSFSFDEKNNFSCY